MKICVVGAGVIGLSSALRIQESHPDVEITLMSDRFSPNTTSDVSGGFWSPVLIDVVKQPIVRVWARETLEYMSRLCLSSDAAHIGAQFMSGYYMPKREQWFTDMLLGCRDMTGDELRLFEDARSGVHYSSVSLDVRSYLPWLTKRFKAKGGMVLKKKVLSWDELADEFDIAVNCCGVWSGDLADDPSVRPVSGQLLRVHAPWIKQFIFYDYPENYAYIIPGAFDVVLGGTKGDGDWSEKADIQVRERIRKNCTKLIPSLQDVKFSSDWIGLRPARPAVRLELEVIRTPKKIMVVHNYGHGGSGVTLHWGCAREAVKLVSRAITMLETQAKL